MITHLSFQSTPIKNHTFFLNKKVQNSIANTNPSRMDEYFKHHFIVIKVDKLKSKQSNLDLRFVMRTIFF